MADTAPVVDYVQRPAYPKVTESKPARSRPAPRPKQMPTIAGIGSGTARKGKGASAMLSAALLKATAARSIAGSK